MLNAINTKLLIAILAVLGGIGALLVHQQEVNAKSAEAAAKTAAILQQQQQVTQQREKQEQDSIKEVKRLQRMHNTMPADESDTWATYTPFSHKPAKNK